jgi:LysM repeat protein
MKVIRRKGNRFFLLILVCLIVITACNMPFLSQNTSIEKAVPGPAVAFQTPSPGSSVVLNEAFPVFVVASDPLGVSRIELWVGDALVLSQPAPKDQTAGVNPLVLNYSLVGAQPGTHAMIARAYNSAGVLGESLAVHVTVLQLAASSDPVQIDYVVQNGDTLESIADATHQSVGAIQQANPGIGNITPGQHVAIPNKPGGGQQQAQPSNPPAGAQILPGLLPNQAGGAVSIAAGQDNQLAPGQMVPNLFPGFQPPQNALNPSLVPPTALTAKATDCTVALQWQDNSAGKDGFAIYRRRVPDDPAPKIVANLKVNTTSFSDTVPGPGKYEYSVEQFGNLQFMPPDQDFIQQDMLAAARSAPVSVEVKPSAACIANPDRMKHVHIEIQNVTLTQAVGDSRVGAAVWYSINGSPGRRVPDSQGLYLPDGGWIPKEEVVPVSGIQFLNSDQPIIVKFWAAGTDNSVGAQPPVELGEAINSHLPADISAKVDNFYVAKNKIFKVEYKIWIEDTKWTGNGTTTAIPTPYDLRVKRTTATSRVLTWDWLGDSSAVDGFILYKAYSCPGMDTQIYSPQMLAGRIQEAEVAFKSEPMGCVYQYKVSAFDRRGESPASEPLVGSTEAEYGIAGVTLSEIKFNSLPNGAEAVKIEFYVNQQHRETNARWVYRGTFDLKNWIFDGRQPHNSFGLPLGKKEFLTIGFAVSGVSDSGHVSQNSGCSGAAILPPLSVWKKDNWSTVVRSSDGSCEVTVNLTSQPPQSTSTGKVVMPQADIAIGGVSLIGNKVFALVENRGPDPLVNNSIYLIAAPGFQCRDGREIHLVWWDGRKVSIQSNLPQWTYIAKSIDIDFADREIFQKKEGCELGLFVMAIPPENEQKGETPNFSDRERDNNTLFVPFDRILPMKDSPCDGCEEEIQ